MKSGRELLKDDDILIVSTQLAMSVGLNNSIILRQVAYWLDINEKAKSEKHFHEGYWWTYNSIANWMESNFPFWAYDTVRRAFDSCEGLHLLATGCYNTMARDRTKWYTIDYEALDAFITMWRNAGSPAYQAGGKSAPYVSFLEVWESHYGNLPKCNIATCQIVHYGNLPQPLPETTKTNQSDSPGKPGGSDQSEKRNLIWDWVCTDIFKVDPNTMKPAKSGKPPSKGRIGQITSWLKGNLTKDMEKKGASQLVEAATPEELPEFLKWYRLKYGKETHPPKDVGKFSEHFIAYRTHVAGTLRKKQETTVPTPAPQTSEETKAALAEVADKMEDQRPILTG